MVPCMHAAKSAHPDGTCDDYFPFERAMGALVFSLYAASEAYQVLGMRDERVVDLFAKRVAHLAHENETGQLANHQALAALAAYNVYKITGDPKHKAVADDRTRPDQHGRLPRLDQAIDVMTNGNSRVVYQWPEDVRPYFGDGDECHMAFHFPLMPRMYMAIAEEDRHAITDIMGQTPEIPVNCQWAIFLRNHDELTLEMVTDEERDYMYRVYAHEARMRINLGIRRRLAPLTGNDRRRMELLNGLLFSMPGMTLATPMLAVEMMPHFTFCMHVRPLLSVPLWPNPAKRLSVASHVRGGATHLDARPPPALSLPDQGAAVPRPKKQ